MLPPSGITCRSNGCIQHYFSATYIRLSDKWFRMEGVFVANWLSQHACVRLHNNLSMNRAHFSFFLIYYMEEEYQVFLLEIVHELKVCSKELTCHSWFHTMFHLTCSVLLLAVFWSSVQAIKIKNWTSLCNLCSLNKIYVSHYILWIWFLAYSQNDIAKRKSTNSLAKCYIL